MGSLGDPVDLTDCPAGTAGTEAFQLAVCPTGTVSIRYNGLGMQPEVIFAETQVSHTFERRRSHELYNYLIIHRLHLLSLI